MLMKASEVGSPSFIQKVFRAEALKNKLRMSCLAMSSHVVVVCKRLLKMVLVMLTSDGATSATVPMVVISALCAVASEAK
jgi:hypothetical protein